MDRDKILEIFNDANFHYEPHFLCEYVDFCISKRKTGKIPGQTSSHHILPAAKTLSFRCYSNLKINPWNKAELTFHDHYIAHFLLAKALPHVSTYVAFCGMHKKDVVLERLSVRDLIDEYEFSRLFKNRNKLISEYRLEIVEKDGILMTRAKSIYKREYHEKSFIETSKRMKGSGNIIYLPGVLEKVRETKSKIVNGINIDTISAIRSAKTMKQEYVNKDGETTTIYKNSAKKISKTITEPFLNQDGEITSIAKERQKKRKIKVLENGKWFYLKNVFDSSICSKLPAVELRKISADLESKTFDNYLGKTVFGRNFFTKRNKSHLIGLYVERCQ